MSMSLDLDWTTCVCLSLSCKINAAGKQEQYNSRLTVPAIEFLQFLQHTWFNIYLGLLWWYWVHCRCFFYESLVNSKIEKGLWMHCMRHWLTGTAQQWVKHLVTVEHLCQVFCNTLSAGNIHQIKRPTKNKPWRRGAPHPRGCSRHGNFRPTELKKRQILITLILIK